MKAIRYFAYGPPEVLRLDDVDTPVVGSNELLIRVRAAAINPLDFHFMRGTPYLLRAGTGLFRRRVHGLGVDMAGTVAAVGASVTAFKPGDEVFGGGKGTLAEYITVREDAAVVSKPPGLTFEQAASVPVAAVTALQALRDKGHVSEGHKVLINGAGGGVGTFAVQIAKAFGADVTGVCSTAKVDMVASIGADHVLDYSREDFTRSGQRYDLIVDMAGNHSVSEYRRVLAVKGILVGVGGPDTGQWIAPLIGIAKPLLVSLVVSQKFAVFLARVRTTDLVILRELLDTGKVTPVIGRSYPLDQAAEAVRYLEQGHAHGKIVLTI